MTNLLEIGNWNDESAMESHTYINNILTNLFILILNLYFELDIYKSVAYVKSNSGNFILKFACS